MPIYEEKLISPLALRFTQEHMKTIFRDGRIVEETAGEIMACPSTGGDYDVVLEAPFPQIEIIRLGRSDSEGQGSHWFTLDNRRLYCLQKAAMKLWPQRVAAKVEILYTGPGAAKRKYDSATMGESVTVADSCKDAPLFRWDWRVEAEGLDMTSVQSRRSQEASSRDDVRCEVDDLLDVAQSSSDSILARMMEFELAREAATAKPDSRTRGCSAMRCLTPSTAATSDESDGTPQGPRRASNKVPGLDSDTCLACALQEINGQLRAIGADGRLRLRCWNERYGKQLGSLRKFIEARPELYVLAPEGQGKFRVHEVALDNLSKESSAERTATVAEQAVAEIRQQLQVQGGVGHVQLDDWKGRYSESLGSFKAFLRSRSLDFTVVPGHGKFFRIALSW